MLNVTEMPIQSNVGLTWKF